MALPKWSSRIQSSNATQIAGIQEVFYIFLFTTAYFFEPKIVGFGTYQSSVTIQTNPQKNNNLKVQ